MTENRGTGTMRFEQLFVIRDEILRYIDNTDLKGDLAREIARILAPVDDGVTALSTRRDIVELIGFIEETKIRFLRGELRAKELYREVDFGLHQFKMRNQGFDFTSNPVFLSYFSACAYRR